MTNGIDRNVIKPTVTAGASFSKEALQIAVDKAGQFVPLFRSCITCMFFVENTEHCSQFAARPPARVIAYGCPSYDNDDVPF